MGMGFVRDEEDDRPLDVVGNIFLSLSLLSLSPDSSVLLRLEFYAPPLCGSTKSLYLPPALSLSPFSSKEFRMAGSERRNDYFSSLCAYGPSFHQVSHWAGPAF